MWFWANSTGEPSKRDHPAKPSKPEGFQDDDFLLVANLSGSMTEHPARFLPTRPLVKENPTPKRGPTFRQVECNYWILYHPDCKKVIAESFNFEISVTSSCFSQIYGQSNIISFIPERWIPTVLQDNDNNNITTYWSCVVYFFAFTYNMGPLFILNGLTSPWLKWPYKWVTQVISSL